MGSAANDALVGVGAAERRRRCCHRRRGRVRQRSVRQRHGGSTGGGGIGGGHPSSLPSLERTRTSAGTVPDDERCRGVRRPTRWGRCRKRRRVSASFAGFGVSADSATPSGSTSCIACICSPSSEPMVVLFVSDSIDGLIEEPIATDDICGYGPSIAGVVAVLALGIGLRNGAEGGPVSVESADVRHVLLAPISRTRVLMRPISQRVRSVAFSLALGVGDPGSTGGPRGRRVTRSMGRRAVRCSARCWPRSTSVEPWSHTHCGSRAGWQLASACGVAWQAVIAWGELVRRPAGMAAHRARQPCRQRLVLGHPPTRRRRHCIGRCGRTGRNRTRPRWSTASAAAGTSWPTRVAAAFRGHGAGHPHRGAAPPSDPRRVDPSEPVVPTGFA